VTTKPIVIPVKWDSDFGFAEEMLEQNKVDVIAVCRGLFADTDVEAALRNGRVDVSIAGRPFALSAEFFRDLERHGSAEHIANLGRPLLVVHGTRDTVVDIEEGERIFAAAGQPKWFIAVPDGDHLFMRPEHAAGAGAAALLSVVGLFTGAV